MKRKKEAKTTARGHQAVGKAPHPASWCEGGPPPRKAKRATTAPAAALPAQPDYAHLVRSWSAALPLGQLPNAYYLADLVARLEGVGPMDRRSA